MNKKIKVLLIVGGINVLLWVYMVIAAWPDLKTRGLLEEHGQVREIEVNTIISGKEGELQYDRGSTRFGMPVSAKFVRHLREVHDVDDGDAHIQKPATVRMRVIINPSYSSEKLFGTSAGGRRIPVHGQRSTHGDPPFNGFIWMADELPSRLEIIFGNTPPGIARGANLAVYLYLLGNVVLVALVAIFTKDPEQIADEALMAQEESLEDAEGEG